MFGFGPGSHRAGGTAICHRARGFANLWRLCTLAMQHAGVSAHSPSRNSLPSRYVGSVSPYFDAGRGVGDRLFQWLPAAVTGLGVRMYRRFRRCPTGRALLHVRQGQAAGEDSGRVSGHPQSDGAARAARRSSIQTPACALGCSCFARDMPSRLHSRSILDQHLIYRCLLPRHKLREQRACLWISRPPHTIERCQADLNGFLTGQSISGCLDVCRGSREHIGRKASDVQGATCTSALFPSFSLSLQSQHDTQALVCLQRAPAPRTSGLTVAKTSGVSWRRAASAPPARIASSLGASAHKVIYVYV